MLLLRSGHVLTRIQVTPEPRGAFNLARKKFAGVLNRRLDNRANLKYSETMQQEPIIGSYRRFGEAGTVYQVIDTLDEATVKIHVLETEEETSYPLAFALADPKES
jgi:hypothetical protein